MANKTVLITGSSRGLGRSLALVFAQGGFNVILHGRNRKRLEEVEQAVLKRGVECEVVVGDLVEERTLGKLIKAAGERELDVLINNAGIYHQSSLVAAKDKKIREVIETNLIAPILLTKRVLWMFKRGLVININSVAGKNPDPTESIYCASKYGLRGFASCLQQGGFKDVRIIDVYLGAMKTDMTRGREELDNFIDPDEAANSIFALSQDYNSMKITEINIARKNY